MFPFSSAWAHETGLPKEVEAPELWDTIVPVINKTHSDIVSSFLPQHGLDEPVLVLEYDTSTYHVTGKLERPEYGSRLRTRLTDRDFRDLRECLHLYTTD